MGTVICKHCMRSMPDASQPQVQGAHIDAVFMHMQVGQGTFKCSTDGSKLRSDEMSQQT